MCGIFGVIKINPAIQLPLVEATQLISYRGPDDSGYMLWNQDAAPQIFADQDTSEESRAFHKLKSIGGQPYQVAFGHRRLSILDLSPAGHQPMIYENLTISFNGEVYNYLEVKKELIQLGRQFQTHCDTEVILQAWHQWGEQCLSKFNGMFAFLLLDTHAKKLFVVRDRFGVKPVYYTNRKGYIAFASEIKQLRILPEYNFRLNEQIAFDYLRYGYLDHEEDTFEKGILQLDPGHLISFDLSSQKLSKKQWYVFEPKLWKDSNKQAEEEFRALLKDAVKLRLRSDVPVGSALSGGLDSSTIVCLMRELLDENGQVDKVLETVTSCSEDKRFDETEFAEIINRQTKSKSHKVYPTFEKLQEDLGRLIWHLDFPFGSTSQFSQWSVFEAAQKAGLTVMIDGQGADEQLAGYGGNDLSLYTGLFKNGNWGNLLREAKNYKNAQGSYPIGFLLGAFQSPLPELFKNFIPDRWRPEKESHPSWINPEGFALHTSSPNCLRDNLMKQIKISPLPALLRYEDRNSMAFSVESRTPFMDYRLMEFTLGLPEELVYKNGERKFILRKSFRGIVPDAILDRKDKMGFVSAEERWMKEEGKDWFMEKLINLQNPINFINEKNAVKMMQDTQDNNIPFSFEPWRILNFKFWYAAMNVKPVTY